LRTREEEEQGGRGIQLNNQNSSTGKKNTNKAKCRGEEKAAIGTKDRYFTHVRGSDVKMTT